MTLTVLFVWQDMRENEMLWTKSLAHVHYWKLHFKIVSQKSNQETEVINRDGEAFCPYRK